MENTLRSEVQRTGKRIGFFRALSESFGMKRDLIQPSQITGKYRMSDVTSDQVERRAVWISGGDARWYKNISNNVHYTLDRF